MDKLHFNRLFNNLNRRKSKISDIYKAIFIKLSMLKEESLSKN